jgi:hypothetical protein
MINDALEFFQGVFFINILIYVVTYHKLFLQSDEYSSKFKHLCPIYRCFVNNGGDIIIYFIVQ